MTKAFSVAVCDESGGDGDGDDDEEEEWIATIDTTRTCCAE